MRRWRKLDFFLGVPASKEEVTAISPTPSMESAEARQLSPTQAWFLHNRLSFLRPGNANERLMGTAACVPWPEEK